MEEKIVGGMERRSKKERRYKNKKRRREKRKKGRKKEKGKKGDENEVRRLKNVMEIHHARSIENLQQWEQYMSRYSCDRDKKRIRTKRVEEDGDEEENEYEEEIKQNKKKEIINKQGEHFFLTRDRTLFFYNGRDETLFI